MKTLIVSISLILCMMITACSSSQEKPAATADYSMQNPPTAISLEAPTIHASIPKVPTGSPAEQLLLEPEIICEFESKQLRVFCHAKGFPKDNRLSWESNATSKTFNTGSLGEFMFEIEEPVDPIEVSVQSCLNNSCQITITTINVSKKQEQATKTTAGSSDLQGRNIFRLPFDEFPFLCTNFGSTKFTSPFFPPDLIIAIEPMGKTSAQSKHVTPTDHLYVHRKFSAYDENVLAPGDGFIVKMTRSQEDQPQNRVDESGKFLDENSGPMVPDYRAIIMHSCSIFTVFIHLGELAPAIAKVMGEIERGGIWIAGTDRPPIPIKAGEPIAKYGSNSLDWSVHDSNTVLKGFVVPEHYKSEPYKIHTVDPFQYYVEPIRTALLSKVVREAEPRAGKIDYDIEGTIVGNWFLDGTIDYAGSGQPSLGYGKGHLSIAYGSVDPSQIRITIGADTAIDESLCGICFGGYGVRENQPDPATVNSKMGLIKYELMSREEESRLIRDQVGSISLGTFLVQHLGERTLRVEIVPGKTPNELSEFSDAAQLYRR